MTVDLNTTNPLSFIDWKKYYHDISTASELSILYNNYLIEWKDNKETNTIDKGTYVKGIYTQFLKNLNLSIDNNQSLLVVGPSGCGKTSLLRMISGLWEPDQGVIKKPKIGELLFIPQKPYMFIGGVTEIKKLRFLKKVV